MHISLEIHCNGHTLFANEASLSEQEMEKKVIRSYWKTFSLSCGLELTGSVNIYRDLLLCYICSE